MALRRHLKPKHKTPINLRLASLINARYDGSLRAAARGMKMDHSRLWKNASGLNVGEPKIEFLRLVAKHYGVRLDWLVTGEGPKWTGEEPAWSRGESDVGEGL